MPEPKPTATAIAELKKREADLLESRNTLKTSIIGLVEVHLAELSQLGFSYCLVEGNGNGTKKLGRPRKEPANGKANAVSGN